MSMSIDVMAQIQAQEAEQAGAAAVDPATDEGKALAEEKRKTFDLPTNAVKVDPLR